MSRYTPTNHQKYMIDRLADRLNRVVAAAAALGVSIADINDALDGPDS